MAEMNTEKGGKETTRLAIVPCLCSSDLSELVTSVLNGVVFCEILLCFSLRLCFSKHCCVLEKTVVFCERLLCSVKDYCVPGKIVVLWKRLLWSGKDCCVSLLELRCVLPQWATVPMGHHSLKIYSNIKDQQKSINNRNLEIIKQDTRDR